MRRAMLTAVLLAACAPPPRVTVAPSGPGLALAPRAADCKVEFYRTRLPDRAHDEAAALLFEAQIGDTSATAQEALRREACAVGADAVFVTREYGAGLMAGTAVSYRDLREQHRADAAARSAEAERTAERERKEAAAERAALGPDQPPAGFVRGHARQTVWTRDTADRRGIELWELRAGVEVWMAPRPSSGWRRVWAPGAKAGWVEDSTVEPPRRAVAPAASDAAPQKAPGGP